MAKIRFHLPNPVQTIRDMYDELPPDGRMYIAVDPGVTGAMAFVPSPRAQDPIVVDLPVLQTKVKQRTRTTFNFHTLAKYLDPVVDNLKRSLFILERGQPRPEDTPITAFSVGCSYNMWHLYLAAFAIPMEEIMPSVWKGKMGLLGKEKDASRALAMKIFPGACHYIEYAGDHNRAEALLLAEVIRRRDTGVEAVAKSKKRKR